MKTCTVPGCERKHRAKGYCISHYQRMTRGTQALENKPWYRNVLTYEGAHIRVSRERGKAKYHACVDCGAPAQQWSYDHTDPDEMADTKARPYSVKPEHYSPRCIPCHRVFDYASVEDRQPERRGF